MVIETLKEPTIFTDDTAFKIDGGGYRSPFYQEIIKERNA